MKVRSSVAPRLDESATCPKCDTLQKVSIGGYPGDTSANTCRQCGQSFNVHRRSDGSIFSRLRASAGTPSTQLPETARTLAGPCPGCGSEVRIKAPTEGGHKFAVCLECATSVIFTASGSQITSDGKFEQMSAGVVARHGSGGSGAKPVVNCDKCSRDLRCVMHKNGTHYAIDSTCRRLLTVSDANFSAWRTENEPETLAMTNGEVPVATSE
ncbi:ssDNA-binding Zn-finger/Zn-ribbon topoisomerase 1 [Mycobacterium sp. AZCC_0083]|nr:ssDNA-binding Zn-finger/Zn-ribbon topoisomerase 1 [Mycobacterium sp. AZCC_0083]